MLAMVNTKDRFFDAGEKIKKVFDLSKQCEHWMTYEEVCIAVGVPVTVGSTVQLANWLKKNAIGFKKGRTAKSRLALMPPMLEK